MKSEERDQKLILLLPLIGYRFGGYRERGRGHQVLLWRGTIGRIDLVPVARWRFAKFVAEKLNKINRL